MRQKKSENHILPFLWMRGEEEGILREEIEKIASCGIGAICVEARPHPDFCGPGWWHDMDIVLEEAERRNMKVWILDDKHFPTGYANGLIEQKYPERKKIYINYNTADVTGSRHKVTIPVRKMLYPTVKFWELGQPVNKEERAKNQLLAVIALRFFEGKVFREDAIDLTKQFDGDMVITELPEGQWRIFVIYKTRTDGGDEGYINLIDRESAHTQIEGVYEEHYQKYKDKFGRVIAGFFSDEPQFGNMPGFAARGVIGKTKMPLPWSNELHQLLKEAYGGAFYQKLPFLWVDSKEMKECPKVRYTYMDCVSKLYEQNFSLAIGNWCEEHGVEYIGHVVEDDGTHCRLGLGPAHYFRAMTGQHMAGIDCIGGQVVYGAPGTERMSLVDIDGEFNHFTLGKLGASCGHLDPKKQGRTMCELFGAYGWNFGVRDMKYVLDHLLVRGVNYLVPHAFSMAEYPDLDCPPHFYARGNNPQFPYFKDLMQYANRMCDWLSGGTHVASIAVLYDGEAEWAGERMPMQKVNRILMEHQYEFDIVSMDMLEENSRFGSKIEEGRLVVNHQKFDVLVVPYTERITNALMGFIIRNPKFQVLFVEELPKSVVDGELSQALCTGIKNCQAVPLCRLPERLRDMHLDVMSLSEEFKELSCYHYDKDGAVFMLQNESVAQIFLGEVKLPVKAPLLIYRGIEDTYEQLETDIREDGCYIHLQLDPAESILIIENVEHMEGKTYRTRQEKEEGLTHTYDMSSGYKISYATAKQYPQFEDAAQGEALVPISDIKPNFAGVIRYEKEIMLDDMPEHAILQMEHIQECVSVKVNGLEAGRKMAPPYHVDVSGYLQKGSNQICIEVTTTPARDQGNYLAPPFEMFYEVMEETGMYGNITLIYS